VPESRGNDTLKSADFLVTIPGNRLMSGYLFWKSANIRLQ